MATADMSRALDMLVKAVKGSQALFDVRRKSYNIYLCA
jgi:hypothetical protein